MPDGNIYEDFSITQSTTWTISNPQAGAWKFIIDKNPAVIFLFIELKGIPPLVWHDPKYLLVEGTASPSVPPSPTPQPIVGDLNQDNIVNSLDWSIMQGQWYTNNTQSDLNSDGLVNTIDFSLMNQNWLRTGN